MLLDFSQFSHFSFSVQFSVPFFSYHALSFALFSFSPFLVGGALIAATGPARPSPFKLSVPFPQRGSRQVPSSSPSGGGGGGHRCLPCPTCKRDGGKLRYHSFMTCIVKDKSFCYVQVLNVSYYKLTKLGFLH